MADGVQHLDAAARERRPIRFRLAVQVQGEVLHRDGMAVLEAGIAHLAAWDARMACQLLRHPMGVGLTLLDREHDVGTFPIGRETQHFFHPEILRDGTDAGRERGRTIGPGPVGKLVHQLSSSSTTACAARPSPLPMAPRPSWVVAFTLTRSARMPRSAAMLAHMAATWGASLGASAMMVMSAWEG